MKKAYLRGFLLSSLLLLHFRSNAESATIKVNKENAVRFHQFDSRDSTRELIALVKSATTMVREKGEAVFEDFRVPDSRWRNGETYIFVLDAAGNMLVHADPELEGKNQINLKDVNGKYIVRGLLTAATAISDKPEGWYHYEWPVPGGLLPRWKSSYVELVKAPSGKSYIIGSGMYNDGMEREFVMDLVTKAVGQVEKNVEAAFRLFHDPTGPFLAKDAYIFVFTMDGVEIVNPAFPTVEGNNNFNMKDAQGKYLVREILKTAQTRGSGWVDYMWPKPGESIPTLKSAYVMKTDVNGRQFVVGCGVYLSDAPKAKATKKQLSAPELMAFVHDAAIELEKRGEKGFPDFRKKDSRWFRNDTYLFVTTMDGTITFHAAEPTMEGQHDSGMRDVLGKPFMKMMVEAASSPQGEGWVHYMYPEPGDIFPTWKSSYVKRVTFPSGEHYIVGSGIYNMQMDKAFIEDVVNRAATLVAAQGKEAFPLLRDKTSPFVFMDTYVFVNNPDGVELVNPAQPSLEGKNLSDIKDLQGKRFVHDYINTAIKNGSAWADYYWYRPGANTPAHKYTYVRKVQSGGEIYIIGSGYYKDDNSPH